MRRDGGIALQRALRRSGLREAPNLFVGAGFIPPAGVCPTAGFPGAQCAPLQGARWGWLCGWPQVFPSARRGGFHIRPQTSRHRKPDRYKIGPYNKSTKIFNPPPQKTRNAPHTQNPKTKKPKKPPKNHNPRPPAVLPERPAGGVLMPGIPGYPRVYLKNPQHCLILLKSSVCCVTKPWNTSSIPAVPCLASAAF